MAEFDEADRLTEVVKLYFANYLTVDELQNLLVDKMVNQVLGHENYQKALPWFSRFIQIDSYENFTQAVRPIVWDLKTLREEFPYFVSHFVDMEIPDYSTAKRDDEGYYNSDILEEHGWISAGDLMFSRSTQTILIQLPDGSATRSERVLMVMPTLTQQQFIDYIKFKPAMGGGITIQGLFEPASLNIQLADKLGIGAVDTVLIYRGYMEDSDATVAVSLEQPLGIDPDIYWDYRYEGEPLSLHVV